MVLIIPNDKPKTKKNFNIFYPDLEKKKKQNLLYVIFVSSLYHKYEKKIFFYLFL